MSKRVAAGNLLSQPSIRSSGMLSRTCDLWASRVTGRRSSPWIGRATWHPTRARRSTQWSCSKAPRTGYPDCRRSCCPVRRGTESPLLELAASSMRHRPGIRWRPRPLLLPFRPPVQGQKLLSGRAFGSPCLLVSASRHGRLGWWTPSVTHPPVRENKKEKETESDTS